MNSMRVCFFGDSITVGQFVSVHMNWVSRISTMLADLGESHGCMISTHAAAANGRTTRQALEHMPYEIQSHDIDVMIVQYGMNDCNYWKTDNGVPRVSEEAFAANLKEIVDRGLACGIQRIILHTNHPTTRNTIMPGTDISYQYSNGQYNRIIRTVAQQRKGQVMLTDIEKAFKHHVKQNPREELSNFLMPPPDQLHLSEKGHALYFDIVSGPVRSTVKSLLV